MYFTDLYINRLVYDSVEKSYFHEVKISCFFGLLFQKYDTTFVKLDILPYYVPKNQEDSTLIFESRFESGNLRRAV